MRGFQLSSALNDVASSAAIAFGVAFAVSLFLVLTRRWHLRFTGDVLVHLVQKAHRTPLPRIGGVAILGGFVFGLVHLVAVRALITAGSAMMLVVALLPVAVCGIVEDVSKCVGPRQRLFWMAVGALCLSGSGFLVLQRTDVPPIDVALAVAPVAVLFTAFACVGAANAFNIVDGLNGLLGGIALITLAAIIWVAASVGDRTVFSLAVLLAVSTLGWMVFNWPRAALFAGDGGAYTIGFLCGALLLMLAARHSQVSPWFGITAAALPVWETLYSIWRRARDGRSALEADQAHLHQLVRLRLHRVLLDRARRRPGGFGAVVEPPNGLCSPVLWALHACIVTAGVWCYDDTNAQLKLFVAFALVYVLVRRALVPDSAPVALAEAH
jgi:UDP-N-acetylmuramyl pentapeptide phosphotransferase/UDP-N-acetylglucosamine-1-phosphate transferase